mmetsp:Transcript_35176/g.72472  ORF Transcript_35176/g.72472 Transcript_35176/m.72472 type:complete len:90 (-) Transcript_35176:193-462(-)
MRVLEKQLWLFKLPLLVIFLVHQTYQLFHIFAPLFIFDTFTFPAPPFLPYARITTCAQRKRVYHLMPFLQLIENAFRLSLEGIGEQSDV